MNKIYFICDNNFPVSDENLYGTGIKRGENSNIKLVDDYIEILLPLRIAKVKLSNNIIEDIYSCFSNINPIKKTVFISEDIEKLRKKGYNEISINKKFKKNDNIIMCKYDENMKFYKGKLKFFSKDYEYYSNYGGRILFL